MTTTEKLEYVLRFDDRDVLTFVAGQMRGEDAAEVRGMIIDYGEMAGPPGPIRRTVWRWLTRRWTPSVRYTGWPAPEEAP